MRSQGPGSQVRDVPWVHGSCCRWPPGARIRARSPRRLRRHGDARGGDGRRAVHARRRRLRAAGAGRGRVLRLAARGAPGRDAVAAVADPVGRRHPDGDLLLREPRARAAVERGADDAAGDGRDRGLPVLRAQRRRPAGHPARDREQRLRRGHPGRLDADPAVDQERPARPGDRRRRQGAAGRADEPGQGSQGAGDQARPGRGEGVHQGPDPGELPQHRAVRRRPVRGGDRGAALPVQERQGPHAAGLGAARRDHPLAVLLRPGRLPAAGVRPPQHRARRGCSS